MSTDRLISIATTADGISVPIVRKGAQILITDPATNPNAAAILGQHLTEQLSNHQVPVFTNIPGPTGHLSHTEVIEHLRATLNTRRGHRTAHLAAPIAYVIDFTEAGNETELMFAPALAGEAAVLGVSVYLIVAFGAPGSSSPMQGHMNLLLAKHITSPTYTVGIPSTEWAANLRYGISNPTLDAGRGYYCPAVSAGESPQWMKVTYPALR